MQAHAGDLNRAIAAHCRGFVSLALAQPWYFRVCTLPAYALRFAQRAIATGMLTYSPTKLLRSPHTLYFFRLPLSAPHGWLRRHRLPPYAHFAVSLLYTAALPRADATAHARLPYF